MNLFKNWRYNYYIIINFNIKGNILKIEKKKITFFNFGNEFCFNNWFEGGIYIFNYTLNAIRIKSNWFGDKNSKYNKIGFQGFNLYLNMFRFRLHNQSIEYTFVTSISLLRKETGYSTVEIYNSLRVLDRLDIIKITNKSRWDQIANKSEQGIEIDDHRILVIEATDAPNLIMQFNERYNKEVPSPATKYDYYVLVDLNLLEEYKTRGLNERYYGIYCLMLKLSNGNLEGKSYMGINNMAAILGYGDNHLNHMIYEMHRKYVLYSKYIEGFKGTTRFNHYILPMLKYEKQYLENYKKNIDKNIKKWDKKKLAYEKKKEKLQARLEKSKEKELNDLSIEMEDDDPFEVPESIYYEIIDEELKFIQ